MYFQHSFLFSAVFSATLFHRPMAVPSLPNSHLHSLSSVIKRDQPINVRESFWPFTKRALAHGPSHLNPLPSLTARTPLPPIAPGAPYSSDNNVIQGLIEGLPHYDTCAEPDGPIPPSLPGDAPWTQGQFSYEKSVYCPNGIQNSPLGVVLLVPCTAASGREAWGKSPYFLGLPKAGFDICWVDLPDRGLGDMQLSAEFVAHAVHLLALKSTVTNCQISVMTYSQGGANLHGAFTLFPSIRPLIRNAVTIAAPFRGTVVPLPGCALLNLVGGCLPSIMQIGMHSRYQSAINAGAEGGARAQVPLTSIYSTFDEIVLPQGPQGVSFLAGASVIAVQDVCPGKIVDHFGFITDSAAYGIALTALTAGRPITADMVDRHYCANILGDLLAMAGGLVQDLQLTWRSLIGNTSSRIRMISQELTSLSVPSEPLLIPYFCQRGYAPASECTDAGFCHNTPRKGVVQSLLQGSAQHGALSDLLGDLTSGGR